MKWLFVAICFFVRAEEVGLYKCMLPGTGTSWTTYNPIKFSEPLPSKQLRSGCVFEKGSGEYSKGRISQ